MDSDTFSYCYGKDDGWWKESYDVVDYDDGCKYWILCEYWKDEEQWKFLAVYEDESIDLEFEDEEEKEEIIEHMKQLMEYNPE